MKLFYLIAASVLGIASARYDFFNHYGSYHSQSYTTSGDRDSGSEETQIDTVMARDQKSHPKLDKNKDSIVIGIKNAVVGKSNNVKGTSNSVKGSSNSVKG